MRFFPLCNGYLIFITNNNGENLTYCRRLLFEGKLQFAFKQQSPDKSTVEKQHKSYILYGFLSKVANLSESVEWLKFGNKRQSFSDNFPQIFLKIH